MTEQRNQRDRRGRKSVAASLSMLYNIAEDIGETNDLVPSRPRLAHDMLVQLTTWLAENCPAPYLPKPNPDYDPDGPQTYGQYVPLEELKAQLLAAAAND